MIAECVDCGERFAFNPRADDLRELDHDHDRVAGEYPIVFTEVSDADEHALAILKAVADRDYFAAVEVRRALRRKASVNISNTLRRDYDAALYRSGLALRVLNRVHRAQRDADWAQRDPSGVPTYAIRSAAYE